MHLRRDDQFEQAPAYGFFRGVAIERFGGLVPVARDAVLVVALHRHLGDGLQHLAEAQFAVAQGLLRRPAGGDVGAHAHHRHRPAFAIPDQSRTQIHQDLCAIRTAIDDRALPATLLQGGFGDEALWGIRCQSFVEAGDMPAGQVGLQRLVLRLVDVGDDALKIGDRDMVLDLGLDLIEHQCQQPQALLGRLG